MSELLPIHPLQYRALVEAGLAEDLGRAGDLTSNSIVPAGVTVRGRIVARRAGVVSGLEVAGTAFRCMDPGVDVTREREDGELVQANTILATLDGAARSILGAERVALNLLGRMSGIATATREIVDRIAGTGARVVCTRKTTPGLRALEKYAVRCGGGVNHRFGLDDAILIKDNHVAVAGGVTKAIARARAAVGHLVKIEVEVDTLEQLREALDREVDAVLLDNMTPDTLREAVEIVAGRAVTEASGGITPSTARSFAETGVDLLSIGWLTHSAPALDVGLDVSAEGSRDSRAGECEPR